MRDIEECECQYCRDQINFQLDEFLINEIRCGNAVIFAGAGVSTENQNSAPHSLYSALAAEIGIKECTLSFPDLAQLFCQRPDGRFQLLNRIQERFDYISKFSELRIQATRFYQELATMPYLRTFVTTNWDRCFEEICHAKPYVYDADLRFWEIPFRRVLKIHGTIDHYSSLVATRDDYNRCSDDMKSSLIGAKLKDLLTTKTFIFVGYSMTDDDFKEIFEFVRAVQGNFEKMHYFVGPNVDDCVSHDNISRIRTDGTYFLKVVKEHLCSVAGYLGDNTYIQAEEELYEVQQEHIELWSRYRPKEHPQMLLSAFYQDGLIHGYQVVRDMMGTGQYSDPSILQAKIDGYDAKITHYRSRKNYLEVAYFAGYQNALISMAISPDLDHFPCPPRYYFEKVGEMDRTEFEERLGELPGLHKTAFRQCKKAADRLPADGSIVLDHLPSG